MKNFKLFQVRAIANFYSGRYYEVGIDSFFVKCKTPEEYYRDY